MINLGFGEPDHSLLIALPQNDAPLGEPEITQDFRTMKGLYNRLRSSLRGGKGRVGPSGRKARSTAQGTPRPSHPYLNDTAQEVSGFDLTDTAL